MSLFSDTQDLLNDSGVFWTDAHLSDRLNQAQMEMWGRLRHDIIVSTATVTGDQEFVNVPTEIMTPQRIVRASVEWFSTNRAQLERDDRNWRTKTADAPKWFLPFDGNRFQMIPKPDQVYVLEIWGVRYPANEIDGSSVVDLANTTHYINRAVMFRAASLIALNARPDLQEVWNADSEHYFQEAAKNLRKRKGHTFTRLRPGSVDSKRVTKAHMGILEMGKNISDERNV